MNGTEYLYEVVAFDTADHESSPISLTLTPQEGTSTGNAVLRINAGSESPYLDPQGALWAADAGFNTGSYRSYSNTILGTNNPHLYQSRRSVSSSNPDLHYGFNLPEGTYLVVLHFVEVWTSGFVAGARVFDINAEGTLVVNDLDIFARSGAETACLMEFPMLVSDGMLDLDFSRVANNPTLSGIEVFETESVIEGSPTFEEWLEINGLAGQTMADSDGGGIDNAGEFTLQLDPNNSLDDLDFRLVCDRGAGSNVISLPTLKPLGNYHLYRSTALIDLADPANRIDTVTRAAIEAMTAGEREGYFVVDPFDGVAAFYQLGFEPVAE